VGKATKNGCGKKKNETLRERENNKRQKWKDLNQEVEKGKRKNANDLPLRTSVGDGGPTQEGGKGARITKYSKSTFSPEKSKD